MPSALGFLCHVSVCVLLASSDCHPSTHHPPPVLGDYCLPVIRLLRLPCSVQAPVSCCAAPRRALHGCLRRSYPSWLPAPVVPFMVARLLPALSVASVSAALGVPVYCLLFLPCLLPAGIFLPLLCCPCACLLLASGRSCRLTACCLRFLSRLCLLTCLLFLPGSVVLHSSPPPINKTLPCSHTCKKTWQKTSENAPDKHKHATTPTNPDTTALATTQQQTHSAINPRHPPTSTPPETNTPPLPGYFLCPGDTPAMPCCFKPTISSRGNTHPETTSSNRGSTNPDTTNRGNTHTKTTSSQPKPQKAQQPNHPDIYTARTPKKN